MKTADITKLQPHFRAKIEALIDSAKTRGLDLLVFEGLRSFDRQEKLYAQGRTVKGPRVTSVLPGKSWHQWGLAADVVFAGSDPWGEKHPWKRLGQLGKELGLDWGGDWGVSDRPHFELPGLVSRDLRILAHNGLLKLGYVGSDIPEFQRGLAFLGLDPGPDDGIFGERTEAAVERLSVMVGHDETGVVTVELLDAMDRRMAASWEGRSR